MSEDKREASLPDPTELLRLLTTGSDDTTDDDDGTGAVAASDVNIDASLDCLDELSDDNKLENDDEVA